MEYLDSLGMLNERLAAVHCVWLSEEDCYLLAERKANVVNCTVSNLKLASGIAPLNTLMKAGVNVCLGTDGASSNNNLSLFEEMKTDRHSAEERLSYSRRILGRADLAASPQRMPTEHSA